MYNSITISIIILRYNIRASIKNLSIQTSIRAITNQIQRDIYLIDIEVYAKQNRDIYKLE